MADPYDEDDMDIGGGTGPVMIMPTVGALGGAYTRDPVMMKGALDLMQRSYRTSSDAIREAKQALLDYKQGRSAGEAWLAFGAGLLQPTRTGSIGESIGNAGQAILPALREQRQDEMRRRQLVTGYDLQSAALDRDMAKTMANLAKIPINPYGGYAPGPGGQTLAPRQQSAPAYTGELPSDLPQVPGIDERYYRWVQSGSGVGDDKGESGGRMVPNALGSGAFGTYQFMPKTWAGLVNSPMGKQFGLTLDGIKDPRQQEIGARIFTRMNYDTLRAKLGRDPTPPELRAAHALGGEGATTLINAPPMRIGASLYDPSWEQQNPYLRKPAGAIMGEWRAGWDEFQKRNPSAPGGGGTMTADASGLPTPPPGWQFRTDRSGKIISSGNGYQIVEVGPNGPTGRVGVLPRPQRPTGGGFTGRNDESPTGYARVRSDGTVVRDGEGKVIPVDPPAGSPQRLDRADRLKNQRKIEDLVNNDVRTRIQNGGQFPNQEAIDAYKDNRRIYYERLIAANPQHPIFDATSDTGQDVTPPVGGTVPQPSTRGGTGTADFGITPKIDAYRTQADKTRAINDEKWYTDAVKASEAAGGILNQVATARALKAPTGSLAPAQQVMGNLFEAFGGDTWGGKKVKDLIAGANNLTAMKAIANEFVLSAQVKQAGPQTDADANRMSETFIKITNPAEANEMIMRYASAIAQRDNEKMRFINDYRQKNGDLKGAQAAWLEYRDRTPMTAMINGKLWFFNEFVDASAKLNPKADIGEVRNGALDKWRTIR